MKVEFFWSEDDGGRSPQCKSELLMEDGVDILSCLLMDDGGAGFERSIGWIDHGVASVREALAGGAEGSWGRESWAARFNGQEARVYFMDDEDYGASLSTAKLESVLVSWRDFLSGKDLKEYAASKTGAESNCC